MVVRVQPVIIFQSPHSDICAPVCEKCCTFHCESCECNCTLSAAGPVSQCWTLNQRSDCWFRLLSRTDCCNRSAPSVTVYLPWNISGTISTLSWVEHITKPGALCVYSVAMPSNTTPHCFDWAPALPPKNLLQIWARFASLSVMMSPWHKVVKARSVWGKCLWSWKEKKI